MTKLPFSKEEEGEAAPKKNQLSSEILVEGRFSQAREREKRLRKKIRQDESLSSSLSLPTLGLSGRNIFFSGPRGRGM